MILDNDNTQPGSNAANQMRESVKRQTGSMSMSQVSH